MTTANVLTRASSGLDAPAVTVEIHLSSGLPGFSIVGLPESSVREARERVRSALITSHFDWPEHRITVSLAPADIPKSGGRFDLPIALGLLVATNQLPPTAVRNCEFYGELGLNGSLRPTRGLLSAVSACTAAGHICAAAAEQASYLARVPGSQILGASDLLSLCALLKQPEHSFSQADSPLEPHNDYPNLATIRGQDSAKRVLEIAASGAHHLLMVGPPGAGKTLLASAMPGLLPQISKDELLELWMIRDQLGLDPLPQRPIRAPHHSTSGAALIGGGANALPGEASLAHGGILFLDELPEFQARTLDLLRQPLEMGSVQISRAKAIHCYPARFQLIAAMNPCPCGYAGSGDHPCKCSTDTVTRYQARVSGPLLDRIDLHIPLERQPAATLFEQQTAAVSSEVVRDRVIACRARQIARQGRSNAHLSGDTLLSSCDLDSSAQQWLEKASDKLKLSARSIHRAMRVARTIADMESAAKVQRDHLLEALSYRPKLGD